MKPTLRRLGCLSLLSWVLVACGSSGNGSGSFSGDSVPIRTNHTRDRRNSGEDFAKIREAEERKAQNAYEKKIKSSQTKSKPPKNDRTSDSSSFKPKSLKSGDVFDSLGVDLTSLSMAGLSLGGVGLLTGGGEKVLDKLEDLNPFDKKEDEESKSNSEVAQNESTTELPADQNSAQAMGEQTGGRMITQPTEGFVLATDGAQDAVSEDDLHCFFGSAENYQAVIDIFNAATERESI